MKNAPLVTIHLEESLLQSAVAGQHNFIGLLRETVESAGLRVEYRGMDTSPGDYAVSHMTQPPGVDGLIFRRVYHYPFWQIEASPARWNWDVARTEFRSEEASGDAERFYRFWQKRFFGEAARTATREGYVYVPLQGRLSQHRSFQVCSPFEMLAHCLRHDPNRDIVAALHPKERYSEADLAGLEDMARQHPRLSIRLGEMENLLAGCDYVVTQNSSAAFSGYFFGKPALLFAKIDFHHIAITADMARLDESFAEVADHAPAYDKYVWWFWQDQSINAGREDAKVRIAARLIRFGWPV